MKRRNKRRAWSFLGDAFIFPFQQPDRSKFLRHKTELWVDMVSQGHPCYLEVSPVKVCS